MSTRASWNAAGIIGASTGIAFIVLINSMLWFEIEFDHDELWQMWLDWIVTSGFWLVVFTVSVTPVAYALIRGTVLAARSVRRLFAAL